MVIKGVILLVLVLLGVGSVEISERECYEECYPAPAVRISDGCICGTILPGLSGEPFQAFMGIPFAKPPLGKLRFANPVQNDPWNGILNATTPSDMCVQRNDFSPNPTIQGIEDCLYLNVYRPKYSGRSLPVMVFIHGGGYIAGSAHPSLYGPHRFMDNGKVILVMVQYRLGVLGFLSTENRVAPGNFGLKDQAMALRWVRRNIRKFGGYPGEITIFGQSAGASSVQFHMISPLSRGLFGKAISHSGSALASWNQPTFDPLDLARRHAAVVGIRNADRINTWRLVSALREVDATDLVASTELLKVWFNQPIILYTPVIEKYVDSDTFLSEDPQLLWSRGQYDNIPWMTGFLPNEAAPLTLGIITNSTLLGQFIDYQSSLLPTFLKVNSSELNALYSRFLQGSPITTQNTDGLSTMVTEAGFYYPMLSSVKQLVRRWMESKAPLTLYYFNFKGRTDFQSIYTTSTVDYGIVHGEDMVYLFSVSFLPSFLPNSPEAQMAREFVDQWVHFAYNGVLNAESAKNRSSGCNGKLEHMEIVEFTNSGQTTDAVLTKFLDRNSAEIRYWLDVLSWWSNKY